MKTRADLFRHACELVSNGYAALPGSAQMTIRESHRFAVALASDVRDGNLSGPGTDSMLDQLNIVLGAIWQAQYDALLASDLDAERKVSEFKAQQGK